MLVRTENVGKTSLYSVICEIGRYFGDISDIDFVECMLSDSITEIDGYIFWTVDKDKIIKYCKK